MNGCMSGLADTINGLYCVLHNTTQSINFISFHFISVVVVLILAHYNSTTTLRNDGPSVAWAAVDAPKHQQNAC